jgi:phosphopentomutase
MPIERIIIIVADACGVGELPDAGAYGDQGASTIPNVAKMVGGLQLPNLQQLGLGNIVPIQGVPPASSPTGSFGKMAEQSPGKDSTTGHWEMAGIILDAPFPVFPDGFPKDVVEEFERRSGRKTIGNIAASGTEIIERLGEEHLRTGALILYTSADSVFQLAAHEELIPVPEQYRICEIARELLTGQYDVGRVIARPFVGKVGSFERTSRRKDFSRLPHSPTMLDLLQKAGKPVLAIGKIYDLFAGQGIDKAIKTANNREVMQATIEAIKSDSTHKLIFANCVDFDQLWGHRNDETNFAKALEEFDTDLGQLLPQLGKTDQLIITADHGCDPTQKLSTDHSREYVPLLVYGADIRGGVNLGTRQTFADLGATVCDIMGAHRPSAGSSFRTQIGQK